MKSAPSSHTRIFNSVFMIKSPLRLTLAGAVIAAISGNTGMCFAQAISPPNSMALRAVMRSLGRDMQTTTDAISKEDWALVAEMAQRIARHAEPPLSERKLILDWLGSDSELFEHLDEQTHEVARAMRRAAESGDGPEVIENFARLQDSCLACHQRFRKAFVEHFYAENR
jgi:cytochrome c556